MNLHTHAAVDCGTPPGTTNGQVTASSTDLDSVATYQCNSGYRFNSGAEEITRTCQRDATWSDVIPVCERELSTIQI